MKTFEPSREQNREAEHMSRKYGRSAVERQDDGSVIITGLIDDIEMEKVRVDEDGGRHSMPGWSPRPGFGPLRPGDHPDDIRDLARTAGL